MIGWILLGVFLFLLLAVCILLLSPCTIFVTYLPKEEEGEKTMDLRADFRLIFFQMNLYPGLSKRLNIKDFSIRNLRRRKKKAKKSPTAEKNKSRNASLNLQEAKDLLDGLKLLYEFLKEGIYRNLESDIQELKIAIGSDDAATTAYLYSAVMQILSAIFALLDGGKRLKIRSADAISVQPDFLHAAFRATARVRFRVKLCHVIAALYRVVRNRVKKELAQSPIPDDSLLSETKAH